MMMTNGTSTKCVACARSWFEIDREDVAGIASMRAQLAPVDRAVRSAMRGPLLRASAIAAAHASSESSTK
jgi:hypothetical protein